MKRHDGSGTFCYGLPMTDVELQLLREIIDYCDGQSKVAKQGMASPCDSPVLAARRKTAYADVARHARILLIENGADPSGDMPSPASMLEAR